VPCRQRRLGGRRGQTQQRRRRRPPTGAQGDTPDAQGSLTVSKSDASWMLLPVVVGGLTAAIVGVFLLRRRLRK